MSLLPPKVNVPATPAIEGVDIRTLYDIDHATLLGKGGFSEVLACRHVPTNELRALKVMKRDILVGKKGEMVAHEKEILRRTCHPNIVTLYETIQNPDRVYFALDLMNEDLFELIVRNKRVNEVLTRKIVFSILSAVNYLHEQSIVHRDIKPENILINVRYTGPMPSSDGDSDGSHSETDDDDDEAEETEETEEDEDENEDENKNKNKNAEAEDAQAEERKNSEAAAGKHHAANPTQKNAKNSKKSKKIKKNSENRSRPPAAPPSSTLGSNVSNLNDLDPELLSVDVKLADFGLAKLVVEWDVRSTPCGTSFYIAPEVIRGIESQGARPLVTTQRLVKSVDVWSTGVVLFVLLSGRPPFHGQVKTGEERRALLKKIDHGVLFSASHGWDRVSEEAKDLILKMLAQDSARRITAAECLRHPFFTNHGFLKPTPGGDPLKFLQRQKRREGGAMPTAPELLFSAEEQQGAFIVGEGSASVRAQLQNQQHNNNNNNNMNPNIQNNNNNNNNNNNTISSVAPPPAAAAATTTSHGHSASRRGNGKNDAATPRSSGSSSGKSKKTNLFSNMKYFFTGGSGSSHRNGHNTAASADKEREEQQQQLQLHAELEALRQEVIDAEDKEGDVSAYTQQVPIREQRPAKPAKMNPNAKVGPAALKK